MQFQFTPYTLPLLAAAVVSMWVAFYAWPRRAIGGALALAALALAITAWSVGYIFEIAGADLPTKLFWGKMQYIGIVTVPLMWLIFTFNHANQTRRLSRHMMAILTIIPLITLVLVFTTETHGLVWQQNPYLQQARGFSVLGVSYGFWFWIHSVYSYLLLLAGTIIILRSLGRRQGLFRGQTTALIIAVLAPWVGNILYISGLSPIPHLDITPFAFTVTLLALTWGIFGFQLINLAPIARELVVEEMFDGMLVLDAQGYIADINPTAQRMLGQTAAQVVGQSVATALGSWSYLIERYKNVLETLDEIVIGEGEAQRWYELRLSPLYDRRQRFMGRVIIFHNITGRKRAEEALAHERTLLRTVIDNIPDQIFARDTTSRYTLCNQSDARAIGVDDPDTLLGKNDFDFYPPELATNYRADDLAVIQSGQPIFNREEPNRTIDGQPRWLLTTKVPLRDRQGQIIGLVGIARDITERKRIEEQLRQLARAVEASPASIVITDTEAKIQYVNPKFTQMTGYTLEEALGQNPRILKTKYTPPATHQKLWQTITAGQEWHGEFCNRKKNGELFWEFAAVSPITDAAGVITHYVAVKEDITERKRMQEELAQARDQALAASGYKSELLAKVSHELRTPLGAILGFAEILHNETTAALTPQQKRFTAKILDSAAYLNSLISDLLDQSQIEQGQMRIQAAFFNLREMVENLSVSLAVQAEAKGLHFTTEIAPDLPDILTGDEKRLRQIITNLVNNSLKFTETGSVTVHIYRAEPQQWAIQVADTGPGIASAAQPQIFDAFWQIDNTLTGKQKGYGLGLSIVKQLTTLMGGEISLKSEVGRGSTFTVLLPLK
jgi:PAS domain S-box-containing protein